MATPVSPSKKGTRVSTLPRGAAPSAAIFTLRRDHKAYVNGTGPSVSSHLSGDVDNINRRLEERHGRQRNANYRPRGAALAEEIFRIGWGSDVCESSESDSNELLLEKDLWGYQPSLELETTLELQERLQSQIRKFEYAYESMCIAALRWHQLMEDVHYSDQVKKQFLDLQMIRKLSGLDYE